MKNTTSRLMDIQQTCDRAIAYAAQTSRADIDRNHRDSRDDGRRVEREPGRGDRQTPIERDPAVPSRPARRAPGKHPYARRVVDKAPR